MAQQNSGKRREGTAGVKALIATASVAATLAGWAILPSNDPPATSVANNQTSQPAAISAPGTTNTAPLEVPTQVPEVQAPPSSDPSLPQLQAPQGFSNWPSPFSRSHSSR